MRKILIGALVFCLMSSSALAEEMRFGTTFSQVQCNYFGMEWKESYEEVLGMGFNIIRLGAYWNEIEQKEGSYDFSSLDWQIKKAAEKNIPIVLTVGMKAPRWPEFYFPKWVEEKIKVRFGCDVSKDPFVREKVLKFITKTIKKYKDSAIIKYWQVENEAGNKIGEKSWYIDPGFLKDEAALVRMIDPERKIIMTKATYPNKVLRFFSRIFMGRNTVKSIAGLCDIVGLNVYPDVGVKVFGRDLIFNTGKKERLKYFNKVIKEINKYGKTTWVLELQAEPWDPGHLVYLKKNLPKTASVQETRETFFEFKQLGIDTIFFWGVEYWLYRSKEYQDDEWIELFDNIKKGE